jgi:branched-chain amino acid transport system permease protein
MAVSMAQNTAIPLAARSRIDKGNLAGVMAIVVIGILGFYLFPDNLALLTRIVAMALLVLSIDLVTGYCGVATLGHAALFGAGAYGAGIASAHFGISEPVTMTLIGALIGSVAGLISGLVILRAHGLAQLVLSIAVVHLFHEAANKASAWTGGSDGLSGIMPEAIFGVFEFDLWGRTAYIYGLVILVLVFIVLRLLVRSPFGMLARGIREDHIRVSAMGASVHSVLLRMYVISGAVAGIGGALAAISTQVVGLDSLSFTLSAEAMVMLVLGGTGSLYGGIVGTVVFMWFEDTVSALNPFHWLTIIGALLIGVVLFAPKGIFGSAAAFAIRLKRGRS